jgi:hypothetical protein
VEVMLLCLGWSAITLLPYAFLLYMERVPSRHTYLCSLGLSLMMGYAGAALWERSASSVRPWAMAAVIALVAAQNVGYLWMRKLPSYRLRAETTERFLEFVREQPDKPVRIECAPFPVDVFRYAARVRLGKASSFVLGPKDEGPARNWCDGRKI